MSRSVRRPTPGRLRVSGGCLRGRVWPFLETPDCRPTQNKTRQLLFNWLGHDWSQRCHGLELFAGSGIVAVEALSHGLPKVTCVDRHHPSLDHIRSTAAAWGLTDRLEVRAQVCLAPWARRDANETFDVVFCDPPYAWSETDLNALGAWLAEDVPLAPSAEVVVEHASKTVLTWEAPWSLHKTRRWGRTQLTWFRRRQEAEA